MALDPVSPFEQDLTWFDLTQVSEIHGWSCSSSGGDDILPYALSAPTSLAQSSADPEHSQHTLLSSDAGNLDEKRARRKAQNRAAQRALRIRKEDQLHALEQRNLEYEAKMKASDAEVTDLRAKLSVAEVQIGTLRSMLSTALGDRVLSNANGVDGVYNEDSHTLTLTLDLSKLAPSAMVLKAGSSVGTSWSSSSGMSDGDTYLR